MKISYAIAFFGSLGVSAMPVMAQCTTTNATTCQCETAGQTNCDLMPDLNISWYALQSYAGGPSEYAQTDGTNPGRLRVSGSTPNIGFGPLEVRGVNSQGYRTFICGPDTMTILAPNDNNGFTCPNGFEGKQRLYQRIYHKDGNTMSYTEELAGTMTYHPTHNHYHVDDWTTMTLRLEQPGVPDPRDWPVVASGGKLGFCLMDLSTCSSSNGHCRTSHLYNQGSTLTNTSFPNYGLGIGYSCSENFQGISSGKTDIYSESLDGMWINILPGLCNGNYWIVAEVDPRNAWTESNEDNNWTAIPFQITQQSAAGGGGAGSINADRRAVLAPGDDITLTATPGYSYLWSNGATTRSITVNTPATYSCTITAPCGSFTTPSITVTALAAPAAPAASDVTIPAPGTAALSAAGGDLVWYDAATGGSVLGSGTGYVTPVISQTTPYWVEDRAVSPGVQTTGGKSAPGTGSYSSVKQYMYFDANEPFELVSFDVQANSYGKRYFVLFDVNGNQIAEKYAEIPVGTSTVTVNWKVPAGLQHRITAYDENSDVVRDLWRDNAGVSYPYALGTLGSITGSSAGAQYYYYLYNWVVRTEDVVAVGPRTMVNAIVNSGPSLQAKVVLGGPFDGGTGLMSDAVRASGLVPLAEPYTALGFTQAGGGGGETTTPAILAATGSNAIVDWVRIELRSTLDPTNVVATRQALVQRDGDIVSSDGAPTITFAVAPGNYHVAVRHRNHQGCMTLSPLSLSSTTTVLDMGSSSTIMWGSAARKDVNGTMVLWSGNVFRDAQLRYTGANNDRDPILNIIGGVIPTSTVSGYLKEDANLDGAAKYTGAGNDRDVILNNLTGGVPTATRAEQLP